MSGVFCNSITDPLFEPLEILVEEPLFFEEHGAELGSENQIKASFACEENLVPKRGGRLV